MRLKESLMNFIQQTTDKLIPSTIFEHPKDIIEDIFI